MHRIAFAAAVATSLLACPPPGPGPDAGTDAGTDAGPTCPAFTGPTTHRDTITADETWTAAASPHLVTFDFTIARGATVTIEPCAEVRFGADHGLIVAGRLVADGTGEKTIHFTADDPAHPWSSIWLRGGSASFTSVLFENGGSTGNPDGKGVIDARGDPTALRQETLHVQSVAIKGSQQYGVSLRDGATFTADSSGLSIEGARLGAVRTWARLAGNIPPGKYTGNTVDEIVVTDDEVFSENTTFHNRGVPYRMGESALGGLGSFIVGVDGSTPKHVVWTIEAGITLRIAPGGRLATASIPPNTSMGAIVAQGAPLSPVIFTSGSSIPGPGDWIGLWFNAADVLDHFDFTSIEFAGGPSGAIGYHCDRQGGLNEVEDAAIILFGNNWFPFITNSTISGSAGYAIDRAWNGDPTDFLLSNNFAGNARCKMSYPRDSLGNCPGTIPCP